MHPNPKWKPREASPDNRICLQFSMHKGFIFGVEDLADEYKRLYCFKRAYDGEDDDELIEVWLAVALDRRIEGMPVWLFFVTASGGLKSILANLIRDFEDVYSLDSLTPKTIASGFVKKQNKKTGEVIIATGLGRQLHKKLLVIKDFTEILSMRREARYEIFGQLRSIWDGYYERSVGTSDEKIQFDIEMGFLSGVTPEIDRHHVMIARLGERYLKIRTQLDDEAATHAAFKLEISSRKKKKYKTMLRKLTKYFLEKCINTEMVFEYSEKTEKTFVSLARIIEKFRTPTFQTREAGMQSEYEIQSAYPTRLVIQLHKLAKMLCVIRNNPKLDDQFPTVFRVAMDTLPRRRAKMLAFLFVHRDKEITEQFIRNNLHIGGGTTQKLKHDLGELNLVNHNFKLTSWILRCMMVIMSSIPQWRTRIGYYIYIKREKKQEKDIGGRVWGMDKSLPLDLHYIKSTYCRCPECVVLEKKSKTHHVYCWCAKCARLKERLMHKAFQRDMKGEVVRT